MAAYRRITAAAHAQAPEARLEGVQVEEMVAGGFEIIIGLKRDDQFGSGHHVRAGGHLHRTTGRRQLPGAADRSRGRPADGDRDPGSADATGLPRTGPGLARIPRGPATGRCPPRSGPRRSTGVGGSQSHQGVGRGAPGARLQGGHPRPAVPPALPRRERRRRRRRTRHGPGRRAFWRTRGSGRGHLSSRHLLRSPLGRSGGRLRHAGQDRSRRPRQSGQAPVSRGGLPREPDQGFPHGPEDLPHSERHTSTGRTGRVHHRSRGCARTRAGVCRPRRPQPGRRLGRRQGTGRRKSRPGGRDPPPVPRPGGAGDRAQLYRGVRWDHAAGHLLPTAGTHDPAAGRTGGHAQPVRHRRYRLLGRRSILRHEQVRKLRQPGGRGRSRPSHVPRRRSRHRRDRPVRGGVRKRARLPGRRASA